MTAEDVAATAAAGAVIVTVLGGIVGLVYHAGRHAQRLSSAEKDIGELRAIQDEHSRAISAWDQALKLLEEVRHDVKNLLTGRIQPGRRRSGGD